MEAATRAARANITIEEQIHQIHKVKGLLPDEEKEKIGPKPVGGNVSTYIYVFDSLSREPVFMSTTFLKVEITIPL